MLRIATWNLAKRASAAAALPEILDDLGIDVLLAQEIQCIADAPNGFELLHTPDLAPDTGILLRGGRFGDAALVEPSPLAVFGSYATVAECVCAGESLKLASVHALARTALSRELIGLDPQEARRPDVASPWLNDVAFHHLQCWVHGSRFVVGADLNTSRLFPGGMSYFARAAEAGWVDVVYAAHGDQVPTFITRRSGRHQLDYLFADESTAATVTEVGVDSSTCESGASDHAIVWMDVDLHDAGPTR